MAWPDEIVQHIASNGLGVPGTDLFVSSKAAVPTGPGPYTVLIETSGSGGDYIQNEEAPAYEWPGLQVTVIGNSVSTCRAHARALWTLLGSIGNEFLNGVWYIDSKPMQVPRDAGLDATNRSQFQFNVLFNKRTS